MDALQRDKAMTSAIQDILGDEKRMASFTDSLDAEGATQEALPLKSILVYTVVGCDMAVVSIVLEDDYDMSSTVVKELVEAGLTQTTEQYDQFQTYKKRFTAPFPAAEEVNSLCNAIFSAIGCAPDFDLLVKIKDVPGLQGLRDILAIQHSSSWYRGPESVAPAPYIIFCGDFGIYEGFYHEADVTLGNLGYLTQGEGLPAEDACVGMRAYGWTREVDFPVVDLEGECDFTLPDSNGFWSEASNLAIPGVGYGVGGPASGMFFVVHDEQGLSELRQRMAGKYQIVELRNQPPWMGPYGLDLDLIDQARRTGDICLTGTWH
jgi:hypothetical protein